jgi:hypothetical protein
MVADILESVFALPNREINLTLSLFITTAHLGLVSNRKAPMKKQTQDYLSPLIEMQLVVAERGYAGSMFEDPIEQPEQGW